MSKLTAILLIGLFSLHANASRGIFFGVNKTNLDTSGGSYDSATAIEMGYTKTYDFKWPLLYRTGIGYHRRSAVLSTSNIDVDLAYIEIPVTGLYKLNDLISVFGGVNLALNIQHDCTGIANCTIDEAESLVYNLALGARFKFTELHGAELSYDKGLSDIFLNTELKSSLGIRYIYQF